MTEANKSYTFEDVLHGNLEFEDEDFEFGDPPDMEEVIARGLHLLACARLDPVVGQRRIDKASAGKTGDGQMDEAFDEFNRMIGEEVVVIRDLLGLEQDNEGNS